MEFGPILRAMSRNKIGVGLLVFEIAVTMAIVINCATVILGNRERMVIPTGIDDDHIIVARMQSYGEAFSEAEFLRQVIDRDLATLRAMPGVISASAFSPTPLQGGGSSTQMKVMDASNETLVRTPVYRADEHFLETLGLELVAGRPFTKQDLPDPDRDPGQSYPDNLIVTQDLADALFPNGDALGKQISDSDDQRRDTIVGIVNYMFTPYDNGVSGMEKRIAFYPRQPGGASFNQYLMRTEPGSYDQVFTSLEETLASVNPERLITTLALGEIKERGQFFNRFIVNIMLAIMIILLFVTAIGIFGLTSFAVSARTKQIGTRRALGATKMDIVRYFLLENSLITFMGIALGLVMAFPLNRMMINNMNSVWPLSVGMVLLALGILWTLGILSTLAPALRGANIPPVIAANNA